MHFMGLSTLLLSLAAGYIILIKANGQEKTTKMLGKVIAGIIITVSVLSLLVILWCSTCRLSGKSCGTGACFGKYHHKTESPCSKGHHSKKLGKPCCGESHELKE